MAVTGAAELNRSSVTDTYGVLAKASAMAPWLGEQASRIENARRIPDDVAEKLFEAGVFQLTRPRRFGGHSASLKIAWEVTFEIARGCSSCAWIAGLTAANILMIGKFSKAAQDDVFAQGSSPVVPMLTGGVGSGVTIERAEGGIVLSGRWRYASGIDVASWVGLLVPLPQPDGSPDPHVVLVPQREFEIDHDSWHVLGMRGTGSKNIALDKVFVPEHRFMSWAVLQAGGKHPTCPNDEPIFKFPLNSINAMSVLAPTLGVACAVSDEYARLVEGRVSSGNQQQQIGDKVAHIELGSSVATMDLLCTFLLTETELIEAQVLAGRQIETRGRALSRTKMAIAARQAFSATQGMFTSLGGSILPEGTRIERLFRDMHAMSSHFLLQREPIAETYGRLLLGLEPPPGARI